MWAYLFGAVFRVVGLVVILAPCGVGLGVVALGDLAAG